MSDDRADGRLDRNSGVSRQRPLYSESQVIMTTVKAVVPFILTYGLFMMFHGADTPGGGFQAGALIASVVVMIAFAFGIESIREWLSNTVVVGLGTVGVLLFAGIGLGPIALGGNFLEYAAYAPRFGDSLGLADYEFIKYGMEAVEIGGIAFIVSGILMGLFFVLAAGFDPAGTHDGRGGAEPTVDGDEGDQPPADGDGDDQPPADDAASEPPADGVTAEEVADD